MVRLPEERTETLDPVKANVDLSVGAKADGAKVRLDLLPPGAMVEIAKTLTFGAQKYAAWNWSKGLKNSRLFAATLRHLFLWWAGETYDKESGLHHLAHAGFGILVMLENSLMNRIDLDDRPFHLTSIPTMEMPKGE